MILIIFDILPKDDWTPLHWAVRGKRTESLIQELLERGARINSQDKVTYYKTFKKNQ